LLVEIVEETLAGYFNQQSPNLANKGITFRAECNADVAGFGGTISVLLLFTDARKRT
jgi:hypothetical protein